jgi:hypothetical protein
MGIDEVRGTFMKRIFGLVICMGLVGALNGNSGCVGVDAAVSDGSNVPPPDTFVPPPGDSDNDNDPPSGCTNAADGSRLYMLQGNTMVQVTLSQAAACLPVQLRSDDSRSISDALVP